MHHPDLFEAPTTRYVAPAHYPDVAGFKERSTSKEAAERIEANGAAEAWRKKVLFTLRKPSTAKEVAAILRADINTIRPRITELKIANLVEETGDRRDRQHVYVAIS